MLRNLLDRRLVLAINGLVIFLLLFGTRRFVVFDSQPGCEAAAGGCVCLARSHYGRCHSPDWRERGDVLSLAQEFGGLKADQVKRLKELELENSRLRKAVSDLTLDKLILTEAARGNF